MGPSKSVWTSWRGMDGSASTFLFVLLLYVPVNSYLHAMAVSLPNPTCLPGCVGLNKRLTSSSCTYILLVAANNFSWKNQLKGGECPKNNLWSISWKVRDWVGIKHLTSWFAVRHAAVVRHVTNYAPWPSERARGSLFLSMAILPSIHTPYLYWWR